MNFLNIALLGGALAFLAPLLIHLLNRSKFRNVDWGAMHLLESALQANSRRIQWESLLLLLIRCLIPILLAVCLARPVLTHLKVAGYQGEKSIVLLVDNSLSMNRTNDRGQSYFQSAINETQALLRNHRSTEVGLWLVGVKALNALGGTSFDPIRIQRELTSAQAVAGGLDIVAAITAGIEQLVPMSNPSKHLILLSDFQASDWGQLSEAQLASLRAQLARDEQSIQLSLLRVSQDVSSPANLSVRFVDSSEFEVALNESHTMSVEIANQSATESQATRAILMVDGQQISSRTATVPAGASERLLFACQFTQPGWHWVTVQIEDNQGLQGDNLAYRTLEVGRPTRVLLIAQSGASGFGQASDFVRLALAPFEVSDTKSNRFQVDVTDPGKLDNLPLKNNYDAVILAGAARLSEFGSQALVEYVRQGGGLLIFPDDNLDVAWFNQHWSDAEQLLPMRFADRIHQEASVKLLPESLPFPGLSVLQRGEDGGLDELDFRSWHKLIPAAAQPAALNSPVDQAASEPLVILQLASGDPFLASRSLGKGLVLQCAAACSESWSNMAIKPVFVPLVQQLVSAVCRLDATPNIQVGDAVRLTLGAVGKPVAAPTALWAVKKRDVENDGIAQIRIPLQLDAAGGQTTFNQTSVAGLYFIEAPLGEDSSDLHVTPPMISIASAAQESKLSLLSDRRLDEIAAQLGGTVVRSAEEFTQTAKLRQAGREIWRWLLIGLILLLFIEILIGRRLAQGFAE